MKKLSVAEQTGVFMPEQKCGKLDQACQRYGYGRNTMRRLAEEAHAAVKIGRSYNINFTKMDAFFDDITA